MASIVLAVCCLSAAETRGQDQPSHGYVVSLNKNSADAKKDSAQPYSPKEGDLVFFDDHSVFWTILFYWAGSGPPLHMGIVVKKLDGKMAILEAGPDNSIWVYVQDLDGRLKQFQRDYQGTITIRRCKKDLSAGESAALTKYALAQEGKRYAILRLLAQGTNLRSRGPVRELLLAETYLDRSSWMCAELAVAAGTVAGLFPGSVKANVTYPLDIANNRRHDLSRVWHEAEEWRPSPRIK